MNGDAVAAPSPLKTIGSAAALHRRVLGHAGRLLAGDAASRIFSFGTAAYLARVVGVEAFGLLTFAQVLLGYVVLVADWGLGTSGVREIASTPSDARRIAVGVTVLRTILAVGVTAVALPAAWFGTWDDRTRAVVGMTLLAAIPLAAIPDFAFRGAERMTEAAFIVALLPGLILLGSVLVVHGPRDLLLVPAVRTGAAILTATISLVLVTQAARMPQRMWRWSWHREYGAARTRLRAGSILFATNLAVLAHSSLDVLFVRALLGDHAVGLYSAAYRVIQLPMGAFYALTAAALPVLVRFREHRVAVGHWLVGTAVAAGAVIALFIWGLRVHIIRLIYGDPYLDAAGVLGILAAAVLFDFTVAVKGTSYIARGWERWALICVGIAVVVNVAANLMLIPRLGLSGAALSAIISYATLLGSYLVWLDRRLVAR
ncbi:MAG: flippase [Armatimonadota bacterium]|nr:flippase [Armatimonadota bacterium]MDR7450410.1 flippase [Armatimonadota bacterium]MDR7467007.1 flippase [Armatimonadota bacterium]MDR7493451.1 flippase [Armatimonadota bacterium]MDR7498716.1 flippase [Armatimonadota bacterium]